jgi:hypothetical protein
MIHYVGETVNFAKRQKYHLIQILGLNYGIFDPSEAKTGKSILLWNGFWRDKHKMTFDAGNVYEKLTSPTISYINLPELFSLSIMEKRKSENMLKVLLVGT